MQYSTGTVSVTQTSSVVTGAGTKFLSSATVAAGQLFTIAGSGILYQIASVDSDTQITLSAPYAGTSATAQGYTIVQSFTPNYSLPYPQIGDVQTATILGRALADIDGILKSFDTRLKAGNL